MIIFFILLDCRSEPALWYITAGAFHLSGENDVTKMASPPAYMVGSNHTVPFNLEGREYKLRYAGAPIKIKIEDLFGDLKTLLTTQYIQVKVKILNIKLVDSCRGGLVKMKIITFHSLLK